MPAYEMTTNDKEILLEGLLNKLAEQGHLEGLDVKNNKNQIISATMDALEKDEIPLTKESLKDPKMMLLLCATLVKAAVTEQYNPTDPKNKMSLDQRFSALTPSQQKECKDKTQSFAKEAGSKAGLNNSQSAEFSEQMAMVVITDSAGNVLGTENRFAQGKKAFDTISAILQRNPDETSFTPFLEDLLENTGNLKHESSMNMKPKFGPPGSK